MPVKTKKPVHHPKASKKIRHPKRVIPRQQQLPGVEDNKLAAIENLAMDYAEIRDQRQELSKRESELKQDLLKLMHKLNRKEYKRDGISVIVEVEEETVKVRVRAEKEAEEDIPPGFLDHAPTLQTEQEPDEDSRPTDRTEEEIDEEESDAVPTGREDEL